MTWKIQHPGPQAWVASEEVFSIEEIDRVLNMPRPEDVAAVGADGHAAVAPDVRDSRVRFIPPSSETQWLYERVEESVLFVNRHFQLDIDGIQNIQLTEYDAAYQGHYGAHVDNQYGTAMLRHRKLSMAMQLNDGSEYDGGELLLYPQSLSPVQIPRVRGMTAFFRSHVIHEVRPVTRGVRRSLVAWFEGPQER